MGQIAHTAGWASCCAAREAWRAVFPRPAMETAAGGLYFKYQPIHVHGAACAHGFDGCREQSFRQMRYGRGDVQARKVSALRLALYAAAGWAWRGVR